jgi:anaerobic ribonucleoside-triphosphate reductase
MTSTNNIKKCGNCGYFLDKTALYCTKCGASQTGIFAENISTDNIPCMLPISQTQNEQLDNSSITKEEKERTDFHV